MTCSMLSAIMASADAMKYIRNPGWRSAGKDRFEAAGCCAGACGEAIGRRYHGCVMMAPWRGSRGMRGAPPPDTGTVSVKPDAPAAGHKATLDAVLLKIPGVEAGDMSGLPAYFVNKKMFACIHGDGVAIRLPVAAATELQFSRDNVSPFQPNGRPSSREWVQINYGDAADCAKD